MKHQVGIPTATQYDISKYTSIEGSLKQGGKPLTSLKERFANVASSREQLLLNRLKKEFKDYLPDNMDLEQLEEAKRKEKESRTSPDSKSKEQG
jgi:hypothetical protein